MPRSVANVEFIKKLKSLSGHGENAAFARAAGKGDQLANVNNYLNGVTTPGDRVLKDCLRNLFGWQVKPAAEIEAIPKPLSGITSSPGIFVLYDHNFHILYIGQAGNLRSEITQTLNRSIPGLVGQKIKARAHYYSAYIIESPGIRHNFEALLIRVAGHQTYNTDVESYK